MDHERLTQHFRETESPFESIDNFQLISEFYRSEGDPTIGRELSNRLYSHAGIEGDASAVPLIGSNGQQIYMDNTPLALSDYVNYAAAHHFEALDSILDFLKTKPGDENYAAMRSMIIARVQQSK